MLDPGCYSDPAIGFCPVFVVATEAQNADSPPNYFVLMESLEISVQFGKPQGQQLRRLLTSSRYSLAFRSREDCMSTADSSVTIPLELRCMRHKFTGNSEDGSVFSAWHRETTGCNAH